MKTVSIIGIGRVGGALALALDKNNYKIENLVVRTSKIAEKISSKLTSKPRIFSIDNFPKIESEIVFITTQDSEIENVAEKISTKIAQETFVFHTSGALSSEILSNLRTNEIFVGSIHPLVSISDSILGEKRFANSFFCLEGDEKAVEKAKKIVEDLGGNSFSIESKYKSLYHAAAVTACGHLVATIDTAIEMLGKCGLENTESQKILLPLIQSTIENLESQNTANALTGTFARADSETFDKHLKIIKENLSAEILEIYLLLGLRSLKLAEIQGTNFERIEKLRKKILLAKNELKC
ncbi:MAG TPA: DUF2520 domain-containing protein [Pyrinomonadaceae bacterium]|nr:DUF2520 domain-containing protein [Pyrinomonadaceae bacterium]